MSFYFFFPQFWVFRPLFNYLSFPFLSVFLFCVFFFSPLHDGTPPKTNLVPSKNPNLNRLPGPPEIFLWVLSSFQNPPTPNGFLIFFLTVFAQRLSADLSVLGFQWPFVHKRLSLPLPFSVGPWETKWCEPFHGFSNTPRAVLSIGITSVIASPPPFFFFTPFSPTASPDASFVC